MRQLRLLAVVTLAVAVAVMVAPADLWGDISGFFNTVVGGVGDLVNIVQKAVRSVIDFFGRLGQLLSDAWDWIINGIGWLGSRAAWLAQAIYGAARWTVTQLIPWAAHWALSTAVGIATGLFHTVERFAAGLVNSVIRWVKGVANGIWHFIGHLWTVVWHAITQAANWIAHATFYVFGLVAHPDRLASWVAAHIVEPVIRWIVNAGTGVVRWIVKQAVALTMDFAHLLERALAGII